MMEKPVLELEAVTSGYNGQQVIRDVTLSLGRGHLVCIVGPNGHGKTTLLRTISGLVATMRGQVRFNGKPLNHLSADAIVDLGVIHIPQGDMIFMDMSVYENLLLGAYLPKAHAARDEHLKYVYGLLPVLEERSGQMANTLSGGERRMLAIGRALMSRSELLLIDEPSLGLAPIVIEKIYELIRKLKSEGRTILVVEENASRVVEFTDTIHLLDEGRFIWSGTGRELAENSAFIQAYLGG